MKKLLLLLSTFVMLTSCTVKEKMILNEDNSGSFTYGFDLSPIMKMGKKKDSSNQNKNIDSTFSFKDFILQKKDSIAGLSDIENDKLKILELFKIRMKVNEEEKIFLYEMGFDFPDIKMMNNMTTPEEVGSLLSLTRKDLPKDILKDIKSKDKSSFEFMYDGVTFEKKILKSTARSKNKSKRNTKKNTDDAFLGKLESMMEECKYSIEYHFPKRIKKVSFKDAVIAEDRKSFVYNVSLQDMKDLSGVGFKVEFE